MNQQDKQSDSFRPMFYPASIAVVGASAHPAKTGNFVMRSAIYSGLEKIYPVNAGGASEILGRKAYPSIEAIPDDSVDLFLFAVPQQHILPGLKSAVARGCRAAVIFSAGFRESGPEGERQQAAMRDLANEAGVKIIGPNTMGFFRTDSSINATFNPVYSQFFTTGGDITVLSQSGGVAALIANQFIEQHLPLGTMVCLGNRANMDFAELLGFCAEDPQTSIVALFVEGQDDLRRFYQAAAVCSSKKPVVVLGGGHTAGGRKIARSHTGSMTGSGSLYRAAFKQAGLLPVNSVQELVDTVKIIKMCPRPRGNRVAIITHTAGPAVLAADVLERGGLRLAEISQATKEKLAAANLLPSFIPPDNPVDLAMLGYLEKQRYISVMEILAEDPEVDGIIAASVSAMGDSNVEDFPVGRFKEVMQSSQKPAAFVWAAPVSREEEFKVWMSGGVPAYPTPERAAASYVNLARYSQIQQKAGIPAVFNGFPAELERLVHGLAGAGREFVPEHQAKQIIELAGIKTAGAVLAQNEDEAVEKAAATGYPVVLKAVAPEIVHKSDVGGVALNLKDAGEVRQAYRRIVRNTLASVPGASLQGVAVQPMLPEGHEVIIGAVRNDEAGPVVMFGLGGIWVEVLKDVTFRLAPVTLAEAQEMIGEIKGFSAIQGLRGKVPIDTGVLADLIVKTSHLIGRLPIREIDLNPVIFYGKSQYAVADARIILLPA